MLFVISPAKSLDFDSAALSDQYSMPSFLDESEKLVSIMKNHNASDIAQLMGVSEQISELNVQRYQDWNPAFTPQNAKQAIYAFKGDVYTGIAIESAERDAVDYVNQHTRILSGLYGVLKPLDLMQAYRLEMGIKLKNDEGANLYHFWGEKITDHLNSTLRENGFETLINLASNEYFKSVKPKQLDVPVITPVFKDLKGGKYKIVSFYAKKARGLMVRYAADHQVSHPEELKKFDYAGYQYNEGMSTELEWVFTRDEPPKS